MATTRSMQVVSWDGNNINDGTIYSAHLLTPDALPPARAQMVERKGRWPLFGALGRPEWKIPLRIIIHDEDLKAYQKQLHQWFDPEDETVKQLVMEDLDGTDDRYWEAVCERLQKDPNEPGKIYIATLAIHNDVRLRSSSAVTPSNWSITATGQTNGYTVAGEDDAYPVYTITPTSGKTGGYAYKRWIPVRWRVDVGYRKYPVDITNDSFNTATLVSGGKMQADGDDLRVWVDGVEVDRWLDGINTTTTKVWVNLDFKARQEATLDGAINSSVDTITVNEDIGQFPSAGILYVDSEAIVYNGKNNQKKQFTGCVRGRKGTTAASHSDAATIWWVQHDVWILYGNSSASAPTVDDNYKPAFNLTSTNTGWDYDDFGEDDGKRTASWVRSYEAGNPEFYGGNQYSSADPWAEAGIRIDSADRLESGRMTIYNPCGIPDATVSNGEKWLEDEESAFGGTYIGRIQSSKDGQTWVDEFTITKPTAASTWESFSGSIPFIAGGSVYMSLFVTNDGVHGIEGRVEFADFSISLNSSNTPTIVIGSELSNYDLDCRITNNTTGVAIDVKFNLSLNEDLEIDTYDKTVIYLDENSSQLQAMTLVGGSRRDWLKLQPGSNTLQFDDTGTNGLTIAVSYRDRFYA